MNAYLSREIVDHRHAELIAQARQARRAEQARRPGTPAAPAARTGRALRRPLSAARSWLVSGAL